MHAYMYMYSSYWNELQKGIAHSITNNTVGWHRNHDDSQELRILLVSISNCVLHFCHIFAFFIPLFLYKNWSQQAQFAFPLYKLLKLTYIHTWYIHDTYSTMSCRDYDIKFAKLIPGSINIQTIYMYVLVHWQGFI